MNNPYWYLPGRYAALVRRHSLELSIPEHLSDAIGREPEGPRGLFDGVEVVSLHGGSIHPEMPSAPRIRALQRLCGPTAALCFDDRNRGRSHRTGEKVPTASSSSIL